MVDASELRRIDVFSGLNEQQLEQIATIAREKRLSRGDIVLEENEQSQEMYLIAEGEVEILIRVDVTSSPFLTVDGQAAIVRLGAGQVFGEMSLVDQGVRSATIKCAQDQTRLIVVPRREFMQLCETDSQMGFTVMRNIASDLSFKLRSRNLAWR